jgi:hypothetical protein
MAKAQVTTSNGARITIEGTADEVAALVRQLDGSSARQPKGRAPAPARRENRPVAGPMSLLSELIDGGFFKKPKELSAIKHALEEQGHFYPVTSLSPVVLRLVRKRQLRRIRDKKRWLYVG